MDASVPIFDQMLGPLGLDIPPAGETPFEELVSRYCERLEKGNGPVHINCMTTMAECRAAILAVGEGLPRPVWVSWAIDEDGESRTRVHMLAALFVAEGMGAAAFGLNCRPALAEELMDELIPYASVPLFSYYNGEYTLWPYEVREKDPDMIPCATGIEPCFISRLVDVGEEIECSPNLLEDIIAAEDDPVGAVKIAILERDDVEIFGEDQYAIREALCLWSDVPELLEGALRLFQGRAFYDGTGDLEPEDLEPLVKKYGLIVL